MKCGNLARAIFCNLQYRECTKDLYQCRETERANEWQGWGGMDQVPIKHIVSRITVTWNSCSHCQGGDLRVSKHSVKFGRDLDKSLKSFPPCYSQSPL
jgi:hypothetical protein